MPHYYSAEQTSRLGLKKINIKLKKDSFSLFSCSGVFSKDRLDNGTRLLIEKSVVKNGWKVLDLGCGIGVVGIALLRRFAKINVVMSDVNKRAVMISKKNVELFGFKQRCKVIESNGFEKIKGKFDCVLLNPPQTAGKKICFEMIKGAHDHLVKDGVLQIVARHKKGGRSLSEEMESVFGNVEKVAIQSGFRIYLSKRE
jgi:16S rRNA (guanine1207-N2)-methyltransferase